MGANKPGRPLPSSELEELEPGLQSAGRPVQFLEEDAVDPRTLMAALIDCARHRDIHFATGSAVETIEVERESAIGVRTANSAYHGSVVVNCAGAWAMQIGGPTMPARPVKGQMISLLPKEPVRHVIRSDDPDVYMVPRAGGLIAVGATVEEVGFDKNVESDTAKALHAAAASLVPSLRQAKMHESWAGLRPALPDHLPALGASAVAG